MADGPSHCPVCNEDCPICEDLGLTLDAPAQLKALSIDGEPRSLLRVHPNNGEKRQFVEAEMPVKFAVGDFVTLEHETETGRRTILAVVQMDSNSSDMQRQRATIFSMTGHDGGALSYVRLLNLEKPYSESNIAANKKLTKATKAEIEAHLEAVAATKKEMAKPCFKVGEKVTMERDASISIDSFFGRQTIILRKGTEAVVDTNPIQPVDDPTLDRGVRKQRGEVEAGELPGNQGKLWSDYMVPAITLFFPMNNGTLQTSVKGLTAGTYDTHLFEQLVVPLEDKQRLLSLAERALSPTRQKFIYEKMGLASFCQKGRGTICLLYGPSGTGKTMTAEALSDKLRRPLIRASVGGSLDPEEIAAQLRIAFQRAERYNAVLLIDEADVFIRKRGEQPLLDGVVAGFLRALEYYQGVLFLTTNLVSNIDPAVFSRAHLVVGYSAPEPRIVWDRLMPPEVKSALLGGPSAWPTLLEKLAETKLNGREIKTVIQNAVTRASQSVSETSNLSAPWINGRFFVEEAEALDDTKKALSRG